MRLWRTYRPSTHPDGVLRSEVNLDEGLYRVIIASEKQNLLRRPQYLLRVHMVNYQKLVLSIAGPLEVRCAGKTGECKGEMTWVWGKGRWKGITGTTPFVAGIYIEEQKKGEVYGSAHWPELTYTLP